jgi:hypothetical protein
MPQEDGASTASTGIDVVLSASMMAGNGSRISPEKEKPGFNVSRHIHAHNP